MDVVERIDEVTRERPPEEARFPHFIDYLKIKEISVPTRGRDEFVITFEESSGVGGEIGADFAIRVKNPNRGTGYWPMAISDWDKFAKALVAQMKKASAEIKKAKTGQHGAFEKWRKDILASKEE